MTSNPDRPASAWATSSVVVPILMNSEELSSISRAAASPISRLWSAGVASVRRAQGAPIFSRR